MMDNNVKDIFRDSFDSYESTVDNERLLKEIASKREPSRKRGLFWILPLGLLLLIGLGYMTFSFTQSGSQRFSLGLSPQIDSPSQRDVTKQVPASKKASLEGSESTPLVTKSNTQPKEVVQSAISKTSSDSFTSQGNLSSSSKLYTQTGLQNSKTTTASGVGEKFFKDEFVVTTSVSSITKRPLIIDKSMSVRQAAFLLVPTPISQKSFLLSVPGRVVVSSGERLSIVDDILNEEQLSQNKADRGFAVQVLTDISAPFITHKGNSSTFDKVASARAESLESVLSFGVSIGIDYAVTKNLSLGSGLEYSRLNNFFSWSGDYISDIDGRYVSDFTSMEDVSRINKATQGYVFNRTEVDLKQYGSVSILDLPFYLRYKIGGDRLSAGLEVGVAANLVSWSTGYRINGDLIAQQVGVDYKPMMKFSAGLNLDYRLGHNFSLVFKAGYATRSFQDELTKDRLHLPGLSLGIRKRL